MQEKGEYMNKVLVFLVLGTVTGIIPMILGILISKSVMFMILLGIIVFTLIAKELCF